MFFAYGWIILTWICVIDSIPSLIAVQLSPPDALKYYFIPNWNFHKFTKISRYHLQLTKILQYVLEVLRGICTPFVFYLTSIPSVQAWLKISDKWRPLTSTWRSKVWPCHIFMSRIHSACREYHPRLNRTTHGWDIHVLVHTGQFSANLCQFFNRRYGS